MVANDKAFTGSIPQIYDRLLVPMIFEPYARDLAQRIAHHYPRDVLETAAGTGVVTGALASHLPDKTKITATDLNEPMLAQAKTHLTGKPQIKWQQADALALPFDDASFDAVACQFGVMFFPDRIKGYSEARRVLKPGGRFFFNVWDRIEENDFANTVTEALKEVFPNDPPLFMVRTPHGYHDVDRIWRDLTEAGFTDIATERSGYRVLSGHADAGRDRGPWRPGYRGRNGPHCGSAGTPLWHRRRRGTYSGSGGHRREITSRQTSGPN
jgi:ubiquinone/menaquinone biosynthesis C-methylase UbiE